MSDYYDLGDYHRAVSTRSDEAQRWFNRGLEQGTIKSCDTFATDDL